MISFRLKCQVLCADLDCKHTANQSAYLYSQELRVNN